jgi:hypothetical protein
VVPLPAPLWLGRLSVPKSSAFVRQLRGVPEAGSTGVVAGVCRGVGRGRAVAGSVGTGATLAGVGAEVEVLPADVVGFLAEVDAEPVEIAPGVVPAEVVPEVDPVEVVPEVEPVEDEPDVEPVEGEPDVEPVEGEPDVEPVEGEPDVDAEEGEPEPVEVESEVAPARTAVR